MKPARALPAAGRERLLNAFETALRDIPAIRRVRVGRRIVHGAGYEKGMPDSADFVVILDFDDLEGLTSYLRHPAHQELGARFGDSLEAALVYDFEDVDLVELRNAAYDTASTAGTPKKNA